VAKQAEDDAWDFAHVELVRRWPYGARLRHDQSGALRFEIRRATVRTSNQLGTEWDRLRGRVEEQLDWIVGRFAVNVDLTRVGGRQCIVRSS